MTQPPQIKACPVPHFGVPFQLHLPEEHQIEVCPFSFQEREEERRTLNEKRLEERRLEEVKWCEPSVLVLQENEGRSPHASSLQSQVPQFKAQPLPDFDAVVLPEKKKLEATKPEPFRLLVDQRGAVKSARLEKMVRLGPPAAVFLLVQTAFSPSQKLLFGFFFFRLKKNRNS